MAARALQKDIEKRHGAPEGTGEGFGFGRSAADPAVVDLPAGSWRAK
jgi:hypothetical protein